MSELIKGVLLGICIMSPFVFLSGYYYTRYQHEKEAYFDLLDRKIE